VNAKIDEVKFKYFNKLKKNKKNNLNQLIIIKLPASVLAKGFTKR